MGVTRTSLRAAPMQIAIAAITAVQFRRMAAMQAGKLTFRSDFDSANLAAVKATNLQNVRAWSPSLPLDFAGHVQCYADVRVLVVQGSCDHHAACNVQEFDLWTFQDNQGSDEQTGHRSWFYFAVSGHAKV